MACIHILYQCKGLTCKDLVFSNGEINLVIIIQN